MKSKPAAPKPATTEPVAPAVAPASHHTLTFRRSHPNGRCSYGIEGVPGIAVFANTLFADGKPPATITVDCALALPIAKAVKATAA